MTNTPIATVVSCVLALAAVEARADLVITSVQREVVLNTSVTIVLPPSQTFQFAAGSANAGPFDAAFNSPAGFPLSSASQVSQVSPTLLSGDLRAARGPAPSLPSQSSAAVYAYSSMTVDFLVTQAVPIELLVASNTYVTPPNFSSGGPARGFEFRRVNAAGL